MVDSVGVGGPPMPRLAFIFCCLFILLAAAATALRVGLPFLDAVLAAVGERKHATVMRWC